MRSATLWLILVAVLLTGAVWAQDPDEYIIDSPPGDSAHWLLEEMPIPATTTPPEGYKVLPAFPRFFWSYGCVPTAGAMIIGYYDNAGFPRMFRNADGSDALCPTGNYPNDNRIFLKTGDPIDMYPSRCAISATEMGVFGRTTYGHVDDYWNSNDPNSDPYYGMWTPHQDNCVAELHGLKHPLLQEQRRRRNSGKPQHI